MKKTILYILSIIFLLSFIQSKTTISSSLNALVLWSETLVPSFLFPLIIIRVLAPYHLLYPLLKPFEKGWQLLFQVDAYTMELLLTSLFLGFPSSSLFLNDVLKTNSLKKAQYERIMYCVFLASPNFILLSLSTIYASDITYTLLYVQLLCIFCLLLLTRKTVITLTYPKCNVSFFTTLANAITQSISILCVILAYLLLTYVIIDVSILYLPDLLKTPLKLLSEFSSGCFYLSHLPLPSTIKYMLTSVLLAYGGLCVHMQIIAHMDTKKFHYLTFIKYRILHMLLAIIFTYLLF